MALINPSASHGPLRGKLGHIVYSQQPDGTITARGVGERRVKMTEAEEKGQKRLKEGNAYVRAVLADPERKALYASQAAPRKMRTCDFIMADFLSDPVICGVDLTQFTGLLGESLLVVTGDDFKVTQVIIRLRDASGQVLEEGLAHLAEGSKAKVWVYTVGQNLPGAQTLTIDVTAKDRAGHSTMVSLLHSI